MEKIGEIIRKRKLAHTKLLASKSKVYEAFLEMEEAAYADGALTKKTKELIAVGISIATNCESCMQWHIDQAASSGAATEEILEAIEVGIEMEAGRATVASRFALDCLDRVFSVKESSA